MTPGRCSNPLLLFLLENDGFKRSESLSSRFPAWIGLIFYSRECQMVNFHNPASSSGDAEPGSSAGNGLSEPRVLAIKGGAVGELNDEFVSLKFRQGVIPFARFILESLVFV